MSSLRLSEEHVQVNNSGAKTNYTNINNFSSSTDADSKELKYYTTEIVVWDNTWTSYPVATFSRLLLRSTTDGFVEFTISGATAGFALPLEAGVTMTLGSDDAYWSADDDSFDGTASTIIKVRFKSAGSPGVLTYLLMV